jgi:glycosyltransferase involved in cell wall biosynthesis
MNDLKVKIPKVLLIVKIPPPLTGFKFMNQKVVDCIKENKNYKIKILPIKGNISKFKILKHLNNINLMIFYIFKLVYYLVFNKFQFVYFTISPVHRFKRDFIFVIILKFFRVKLIYHLHGKGIREYCNKTVLLNKLYKFAYKNVIVICLSEKLTYDIETIHKGPIYILNNGIHSTGSIGSRNYKNSQIPQLIFLSNLIVSKGVYILIEALKILHQKQINFKCNFIGACSYDVRMDSFNDKIKEADLGEKVNYLGALFGYDKEKILINSDVFIYPTYEDAFPLVLLEAQSFSLPIVATNEGAIPEIIDDGINGFIVEKRNPHILAEKIEILINNERLRNQFGDEGRKKYINNYTLEIFETNLNKILKDIQSNV